jgi:hypothetical protein
MGMTIDMTDFEKGFKKLVNQAAPEQLEIGMSKAANELLHDAIYEKPYAPFDKGDLRASARVSKVVMTKDETAVDAGFNIQYAARWHELSPSEDSRINWTLPGSGRKYLESKMANTENRKKYLEVIGAYLKSLLGG